MVHHDGGWERKEEKQSSATQICIHFFCEFENLWASSSCLNETNPRGLEGKFLFLELLQTQTSEYEMEPQPDSFFCCFFYKPYGL